MINEVKSWTCADYFKRRRNYSEKDFLAENQSIVKISLDNFSYALYFKRLLPNGKYIYRINIGKRMFRTDYTYNTHFCRELLKYDLEHGEDNSFYKDVLAKIADSKNTLYVVSSDDYKLREITFLKTDFINPGSTTQYDTILTMMCKINGETWESYVSLVGCIDNTFFTYSPLVGNQTPTKVKLSGTCTTMNLYKIFTRKEDVENEVKRLLGIEREKHIREIGNKRRSILKLQKRISEINDILIQE